MTVIVAIVVVFVMLVAFMCLLRHYMIYDRHISQLMREQKLFDLIWINLKTNSYYSKGKHVLFRKQGFQVPEARCSLDDMSKMLGWDLAQDYRETMQKMKDEDLSVSVRDKEFISLVDGRKINYRSYLHRLNEYELMSFLQDVTDETTRERELTYIATIDFLSHLLTRRAMNDLIIKKCGELRKCGGKAYIIMLDIDDFKFINDTFGHDVGDKVLVEIARIIQNTEGCEETTSRWGGEEFLVLMECEDVKTVEERTAKIIRDVSQCQVEFGGKALTVTVSAGISELDPNVEYTRSVNRADKAMYKSKRCGKNCLSIL